MMAQWFVLEEPEVLGPYTAHELLVMVRGGKVLRNTKVRKDDSQWVSAGDVGGLFEAAVRPTVRLHCPGCQALIAEPPCMCQECGREVLVARREVIENRILSSEEIAKQTGVSKSMQSWLSKIKKRS